MVRQRGVTASGLQAVWNSGEEKCFESEFVKMMPHSAVI